MKLGISSFTYGWAVGVRGHEPARPLDERGLLDCCQEHDVKLLQIGDNLPLHTFDPFRLDRFAERAAREGVQLEVGARRLTHEWIVRYASIARRVGATLVRFVIDDTDYHPAPELVTAILREAVPFLDGLTLGIENHDRFTAAMLHSMITAVDSDRVGVCLDTANSLGAGEGFDAVLAVLAPLAVNLHIKDYHVDRLPHQMGFTVTGRPAGKGLLNLPSLLKRLVLVERCRTAILELWTPPGPRLEDTIATESAWADESIGYLKPFFC